MVPWPPPPGWTGDDAPVLPTQRRYTFEEKREVVRRFQAGEHKTVLAEEDGLSSPKTIEV